MLSFYQSLESSLEALSLSMRPDREYHDSLSKRQMDPTRGRHLVDSLALAPDESREVQKIPPSPRLSPSYRYLG